MQAGGERPLFLSVNFLAPHHENRAIQRRTGTLVRSAPRHRGAFASTRVTHAASFNEADMSDKPAFLQRRTHALTSAEIAAIERDARARRSALLAVDEGVALIVRALRRTHELGETYIVFTSDNGYMQGEHRVRSGKMLPYDASTRVPLIIRGPGLPEAAVTSELVANTDLAPTLLELAGATAGKTVDGRSLLPYATNPALRSPRALLHETGGLRYADAREQDEATNLRRPCGGSCPTARCAPQSGCTCVGTEARASSTTCGATRIRCAPCTPAGATGASVASLPAGCVHWLSARARAAGSPRWSSWAPWCPGATRQVI